MRINYREKSNLQDFLTNKIKIEHEYCQIYKIELKIYLLSILKLEPLSPCNIHNHVM